MTSTFLGNFKTLSPIKLSYNLLLTCGLMNQEGRPWTLIIVTYHSIMLMLYGILAAVKVLLEMDDFNEIIQPIIICISDIHMTGKFVTILVNQTKIRSLLNRLEQLRQQELEDPLYARQITKADNFIKTVIYRMNLFFHLFPFSSALFNVINDYLSAADKPTLTLPLWIPWNYNKSWPYVAALLLSTLAALTVLSLLACFYSLLLTTTFQMSTLLKVLQAKMEVNKANDKNIFRQHINILQLLQQFNELFSGQYYLEILISSIQPCGYCYMLIKKLKSGDSRWLDLLYKFVFTMCAPLWLCACGEEINSQVENLHEHSYRGSWYEESPAVRKDLLILMTVTARPLQFDYRGLVTFNLMCFAKLLALLQIAGTVSTFYLLKSEMSCCVIQGFYSYITMLSNFETND